MYEPIPRCFNEYVRRFDTSTTVGGLVVHWRMVNTVGLPLFTDGQLLLEKGLTVAAPVKNRHVKTIYQAHRAVSVFNQHEIGYLAGFSSYDLNETPAAPGAFSDADTFHIGELRHYYGCMTKYVVITISH
eukprot:TRINITY_DN1505_c0_g1_i1.p1 TRINITY_DN1505_c0_g1~~TRINITY_DN1505_c0_g1_i1.p1  ORF type:complete len:130 (+),score=1.44 TRINITY_DN1505_c0_g1_i1:211-600(+)